MAEKPSAVADKRAQKLNRKLMLLMFHSETAALE